MGIGLMRIEIELAALAALAALASLAAAVFVVSAVGFLLRFLSTPQ
jgi:hypothetical protein